MERERAENVSEYFSEPGTREPKNVNNVFYLLYQEMEKIHQRRSFVSFVSATDAFIGEDRVFYRDVYRSSNIEIDSEKNLLDLTKMFLGTYMSMGVDFFDFSKQGLDMMVDNYDSIEKSMEAEEFPADYFRSVLIDGENVYFNDYFDKNFGPLGVSEQLSEGNSQGMSNSKVLMQGTTRRFTNPDGSEKSMDEKATGMAAYINFVFYPVMFFCLAVITYVIYKVLILF